MSLQAKQMKWRFGHMASITVIEYENIVFVSPVDACVKASDDGYDLMYHAPFKKVLINGTKDFQTKLTTPAGDPAQVRTSQAEKEPDPA